MHAFLDHPGPIPFAHRGGAGDHPENTMAAFAAAVALGFGYLETDVHATADGVLLAFHDDRLERVTDGRGIVADLPWPTVHAARVGGTEPIVRLDDLLAAWPDVRLNLDPKHDAAAAPLVDAIRRHGAIDRVCVGSFSMRRLARIRAALGPALCTSLGPPEVLAVRLAAWRVPGAERLAVRGGGACLQVPVREHGFPIVDRATVTAAHRLGLPVHVWTVDDPAEMERLLDLGVDGIMSDRPLVLRDVLARRGAWHGT
jgi:glycerophosphoryl diester phosphodiesterase